MYIFFQEVFSQLPDFLGPCGTPHQSLPVRLEEDTGSVQDQYKCPTKTKKYTKAGWTQLTVLPLLARAALLFVSATVINTQTKYTHSYLIHNFSDLRFKSHVKHPVSFIKDKVSTSPEIGLSGFQEIYKSSRCCNADFHT